VVGSNPIEVKKGNVETKGTVRSIGITLTSPKTSLRRGEHASFTLEVSGLEGLRQELSLQLANRSPGVVQMQGGSTQTIVIRPETIRPGGLYSETRSLTGVRLGAFDITASVQVQSQMGACGTLNAPGTEYVTAEECAQRGRTFLPDVNPYDKMFVVSS
jgi:hypothetical protein